MFNLIPSSASSKRKLTSKLRCPSRTDSVRYGGILGGIGAWVLLYVLSTSAHAFAPVIAGTPPSPQQDGHRYTLAPTIESTIRTLVQAVDWTVGASPVDARSITLEDDVTDLRELMDSVVAMSSPAAASGGDPMDLRVVPPIVTRILADEVRVGQLLVQMLGNAVGVAHRVPRTPHGPGGRFNHCMVAMPTSRPNGLTGPHVTIDYRSTCILRRPMNTVTAI